MKRQDLAVGWKSTDETQLANATFSQRLDEITPVQACADTEKAKTNRQE